MKKLFLNEKGNTLIIVLMMVLIFTVSGLSLLTTTMNGFKRTAISEADIQATELAEKGIDFLTGYLETETKPLVNLPVSEFEKELDRILQEYSEEVTLDAPENQELKVKIYGKRPLFPDTDNLTNEMKLYSKAEVNERTKVVITTIHLGAQKVPDALKYAVGSYNPCKNEAKCHKKQDDGNMFLHGGVAIQGDVYFEQHMVTKDTGVVTYSNNKYEWIPSDLPSIEGENGSRAKLIISGELYKLNSSKHSYNNNINQTSFNGEGYQEISANNVSSAFTAYHEVNKQYVPILEKRSTNFAPIDIEGEKDNYYFDSSASFPTTALPVSDWVGDLGNFNIMHISKNPVLLDRSVEMNRLNLILGNNDTLYLKNDESTPKSFRFHEGAYIGGDLTIGNRFEYRNNSDLYQKFEIDGPLYVDGDLEIIGANVKFNSTVYVTGKTTIRFSRIEGLENDGTETSLVIFGKDAIEISNMNVYGDEPNIIRGFFYSEELMEIFGVASNIEIQGGVFGRKVVLNATRGQVRQGDPIYLGNTDFIIGYEEDYAENQQNISPSESRLRVIYNPDLIRNPPDGLPIVKDLAVSVVKREIQ
jgi:uncharacterized protein YsxB (DUF464 family)